MLFLMFVYMRYYSAFLRVHSMLLLVYGHTKVIYAGTLFAMCNKDYSLSLSLIILENIMFVHMRDYSVVLLAFGHKSA
jgi:hypothetical protein